jgi:hypothetical protein
MVHTPITITTTSSGITTAPESLLVRYIKAHVKRGEKAKDKAEQHFIAAGMYLTTLKVTYAPTWQHWEDLLRVKVGLSTGRASELMQIADRRKSVQGIRDATTQRVKALRAQKSSLRNEEEFPDEIYDQDGPASVATALLGARSARGPLASDSKSDPNSLIDVLAGSDAKTRGSAAETLINGSRQFQFEAVTNAVVDLYQKLSRAGR